VADLSPFFSAALFILLAFDLLTVIARSGLFNLNLARLLAQRGRMETRVGQVLEMAHRPLHLRATVSLLLAVLHLLMAGVLLVLTIPHTLDPLSLLRAGGILLLSGLLLFWLEWLAHSMALRSPELWALRLAPFARLMTFILTPFLALPLALAHTADDGQENASNVTEADLKSLVDAGQEEGVLEQEERAMIYSIFRLGDTLAREIMVPRIDVVAVDVTTPPAAAVDVLLQSGHSRAPVYKETVDHVLGLLYVRDLLQAWREGEQSKPLDTLLRPAYFVPEAKKVDELLAEMQAQRIHMAIVVDEYGGVAGLVTLEDIVEEIVGEIQDEYDQTEELPYQVLENGKYIFQGRIDLEDFNEVMGSHLPKDEADTLGGFVYSQVGRVPASGESVQIGGLRLTVEQVSGRRIRKIRACWGPVNEEEKSSHVDG
jgi:CBS domain containing-hemolysin-like protein